MQSMTIENLKAGDFSPYKETSAAEKHAELTSAAEFSINSDDTGSYSEVNYVHVRPLVVTTKIVVCPIAEVKQRHAS